MGRRMAELEGQLKALTVERDALVIKTETLAQCLAQQRAVRAGPGADAAASSPSADSGGGAQPDTVSASRGGGGADATAGSPRSDGSGASTPRREYPQHWMEFARWWEGLIHELAPLLGKVEAEHDSAAAARVDSLWAEAMDVIQHSFSADESLRTRMHTGPCIPREPPEGLAPELPRPELWFQVVATLDLSAAQLGRMSGARRDFLAELGALLHQRRALNAVVQASVPAQCDTNAAIVREHGKCLEVAALLERNMREEARINSRLGLEVWKRILTPLQGATTCVGMYPFLPDKLAMLNAACVLAGEPPTAELMPTVFAAAAAEEKRAAAATSGAAHADSRSGSH